jgi:filamentous hemagglutinin family protein
MTARRSHRYLQALLAGALLYAAGGVLALSHAQVTPDPSLGTLVTAGPNFDITGGTRPGGGTNLFHSFDSFSVGAGEAANFMNETALPTTNILSRVTGGNPSNIFGTIQTTGFAGANLFLMNPVGIVFGPDAQLNVEGSFHATTADYIRLGDAGGIFYADPAQPTVLTVAAPSAFGFLTANPGSIEVQTGGLDDFFFPTALLEVPEGETLSLVGGNAPGSDTPGVSIGALDGSTQGYVLAPAGRVNLVSVASAGEALFDGTGFDVDSFAQLGDMKIGGTDIFNGGSIVDGKEIYIRSGNLVIDDGVVAPGGFSFELSLTGLSPDPDGGEVNIKVRDNFTITGTDIDPLTLVAPGVFAFSGFFFDVAPESKVPDINVEAGNLLVSGFAGIVNNRLGPGEPGNITINADTVRVENGGSIALFNVYEGAAGNIDITARQVDLSGDGSPSFSGFEGLGAQGSFHLSYLNPFTDPALTFADAGNINVTATDSLTMNGLAQITTDSVMFGRAGDITINAGDIVLTGTGAAESGFISSQSTLAGDSGNVRITASGHIEINDGFRIAANTLGSGDAGVVEVTANQAITLTGADSRILSVTTQQTDEALNALFQFIFFEDFTSLRDQTGIPNADLFDVLAFLNARGDTAVADLTPGDAGSVTVTTPMLTMNADTRIETSTGWGEFDPAVDRIVGNAGTISGNVGSLFVNVKAAPVMLPSLPPIRSRSLDALRRQGCAVASRRAHLATATAATFN